MLNAKLFAGTTKYLCFYVYCVFDQCQIDKHVRLLFSMLRCSLYVTWTWVFVTYYETCVPHILNAVSAALVLDQALHMLFCINQGSQKGKLPFTPFCHHTLYPQIYLFLCSANSCCVIPFSHVCIKHAFMSLCGTYTPI